VSLDLLADSSGPGISQVPVENKGEDVMVVVTVKSERNRRAKPTHQLVDNRAAKARLFLRLLVFCRWKHVSVNVQSKGTDEISD
jgi:hypothetical protein